MHVILAMFGMELLVIIVMVSPLILGYLGYRVGKSREIGSAVGLLLGFLIPFIGVIIVYQSKRSK